MTNQKLGTISVNKQTIHLAASSGVAVGVQKYTKTHVSGGYGDSALSYGIETIIEFSIQQKNGNEIEMEIKNDNLRVRDGQRVSVVDGYTESKRTSWLIFVNHDRKEWYWIDDSPYSFFNKLGMFIFNPWWWIPERLRLIPSLFIVAVSFPLLLHLEWAIFGIFIWILIFIFIFISSIIQLFITKSAWMKVKPQIIEMACQLSRRA